VPYLKEAYNGELDRDSWGLTPVAQLDNYKGLYFAAFDRQAPPLRDYLGPMTWYLDTFFDRREGGIELIGGVHKWIMPCNWKFPAENFAGDGYHVPWSHVSAVRTGSGGDFRVKPDSEGRALSLGNGHSITRSSYDLNVALMDKKIKMHVDVTTESWSTDKYPASAGIGRMLTPDRKPTGFPLKQVSTMHVDQNGQPLVVKSTTTVTDIITKPIPATDLAMPPGYRKVESPIERAMKSLGK